MQKILALESLRGLAALIVVFSHFAAAFYPAMREGVSATSPAHTRFDELILQSPLGILINGDFAVYCFFILSGFVLSFGFYTYAIDLISAAVKRYFRLAPMVLASVLLSYFILKFALYHNTELANITGSSMIEKYWQFAVNINGALWQGLVQTFLVQPDASNSLNIVLWTIYYELIGSLIVFAFLALTGTDKRRWILYIFFILVTINTYYSPFIIGALLCDLYVNRNHLFQKIGAIRKGYKILLLVTGIFLASYPAYLKNTDNLGIVHQALNFTQIYSLNQAVLYIIASVIFIVLLLTSHKIKAILELKPFVFLGSISYSIYATHIPLLGSLAAIIFLKSYAQLPYNLAALITFIVYIPSAVGVAYLFRKYIDIPSIHLSKYVAKRIGGPKHGRPAKERIENML